MPAPGGPEPMGRIPFSPDDASPSRARLGRVAEMLREAEEATPLTRPRERHDRVAGSVVALVRRRPRSALPSPRTATDDVLTSRVAGPRT
jgi:hypothetical protein